MKNEKTRTLVLTAMFCAIAYAVVVLCRIPLIAAAPYLKYDPKDVIIVLSGFMLSPLAALAVSFAVSFLEFLTVSGSGIIGFVMNFLASAAYCCTAALCYHRRRTVKSAVLGLALGTLAMTAVMLLWNYLITPLYMGVTREAVAGMLLTVFLPFNVLKGALNGALVMVVYRPVTAALTRAHLWEREDAPESRRNRILLIILCAFVLLTCALTVLVLRGII